MQTNNFSAEFTNTGGGVINVVTKSGGNQLHGSAYEYFRTAGLSANNFFANQAGMPRSSFRFHQFGVSLGGPIKKDKTFFFFSYEVVRWIQNITTVMTLPTTTQRAGDFSQTFDAQGNVIPIFDPFTTRPDPANPGNYIRDPFLGNKIPASEINPVAAAVLNYLPLPNRPGLPEIGANNYVFGITHEEPANPDDEKFLLHATAPDVRGPWKKLSPVMQVDAGFGETVVWAPHVITCGGQYWMFYCAGGKNHTQYRIHLATSPDLSTWTRDPGNPMVVDGYDARDPMLLQVGDQWILYYCATETPQGGDCIVAAYRREHRC